MSAQRLFLLSLLMVALAAPAGAGELARFNAAVAKAYTHYRGAVFYLRTGNPAVANIELQQAAALWTAEVLPFREAPPDPFAEDDAWPGLLDDVSARLEKATSATGEGLAEPAAEALAPIRPALAALRARNQVRVFSDCIDEANAAMDALWVFRKAPPDFRVPEQVNDLRAKTAVTAYLYRRCAEQAPSDIAAAPEFKRIMGGTLESLGRMWGVIDAADGEAVISILREIRSFDRMLWLQFG